MGAPIRGTKIHAPLGAQASGACNRSTMRWLIATLAVAVVAAGPAVIYWRLFRADERAQPEWSTEWKRTDRATKRRLRRALRRVETLYNPVDARHPASLAESWPLPKVRSGNAGRPAFSYATRLASSS